MDRWHSKKPKNPKKPKIFQKFSAAQHSAAQHLAAHALSGPAQCGPENKKARFAPVYGL